MKNKKISEINFFGFKKIFLAVIFCGILLPFLSFASAGLDMSKLTYKPLEEIPGFGKPTSYTEYVLAIYDFGLWTVGISAVLMISFGAFMYITSAGNSSTTGKAKGIISDAIAGVILALASYVLIYTINPTLLNINSPSLLVGGISGGSGSATLGTSSGTGSTSKGYASACPNSGSTTPINYSGATSDTAIKPDSTCDQYDNLFKEYGTDGVDPKMLKAIAQIESSCGKNKGPSSSGACGLMQILPKTAKADCSKLNSDDEFSIKTAASLIRENLQSSCVTSASDRNAAIFAGYNSGYGCGSAACSPKKHALCASSDCSGSLAFQCCKNPGSLQQSLSYAWNGIGLMNKLK